VQATHSSASSPSTLGWGGPHAGRFATDGAQVALWLRLPAGLLAPEPVASRDAQLPLPLGEMAMTLEDVALLFGLPCSGESMGVADPWAVARRPPREVRRSGAPSQRARGACLHQLPQPHVCLVAQVQRTFLYLSFFRSINLQPLTEFWIFSDLIHKGRRRRADEQQALEDVHVVTLRLRDVLWVPRGRNVEVPDPHARRIADAIMEEMPSYQLGCCDFGRDVQGPVHRVHQDEHPIDPPRMPASAVPVELQAASRRSAIGRPIVVLRAGGGAQPSRQTNTGSMWCQPQVRTPR
jgi:hypothetical protein